MDQAADSSNDRGILGPDEDAVRAEIENSIKAVSHIPMPGEGFSMQGGSPEKQGMLFSNDTFELPTSVRTYTKAVSAIHAIPGAPVTINVRRLMDACILVAQIYYRKLPRDVVEKMREVRASPMFEVRINYLRTLGGIKEQNIEPLKEDLETLRKVGFNWNVISEDRSVEFNMKSSFVTTYGVGTGGSAGWLRFALEPAALELILDPRMYASFSLQVMATLRTESSYSLYQATWRYINTDNKCTPLLPVETWIELIKGPSRYVQEDLKTGVKTAVSIGDFKRRDLIPAISRINEVDALNYTLKLQERKSGNKIQGWQFSFIPKRQRSIKFEIPHSWPVEMDALLKSMGFNEQDLADMSESYGADEIAEGLRRLEAAEMRLKQKGNHIRSRRHYLRTTLENMDAAKKSTLLEDEKIEELASRKADEEAAERRRRDQVAQFESRQQALVDAGIQSLSHDEQETLLARFKESLNVTEKSFLEKDPNIEKRPTKILFRKWLEANRKDLLRAFLPNPHDQAFEAWQSWRLEQLETGGQPD